MSIAKHLLVSDPERESEWRQILERHLKKPVIYVVCQPRKESYPAEIMTAREYYKQEADREVFGVADSYASAVKLVQTAVEAVLPLDPSLRQLKARLKEIYL